MILLYNHYGTYLYELCWYFINNYWMQLREFCVFEIIAIACFFYSFILVINEGQMQLLNNVLFNS